MKKYRNPLRRSILFGCGAFIVLLCLTLAVLGFVIYYQGMVEKYQTYIGDALSLAMTEVDGEDLGECIESGKKSEKFLRTQNFLDRMKEHYDFAFVCIVKPLNLNETDNMMDVMAAITEAEREEDEEFYSVTLGGLTGDSYSPKVVQYYLDRMNGGTEISYYRNRTEFGYMYTGLMPIEDDSGNTVAILAADLSTDLHHGEALFIYTDGVTEATNAENKLFGEKRMVNALNIDPEGTLQTILHNVRMEIDAFVKDAPQFDDITMLCLRYS